MTVEKQQGMEVLGVYLSPSVSVKGCLFVRPCVMLKDASHLAGQITRSDREAE